MATDLAKLSIEVQVDGVPKAATDLRTVDAGISSGKKATDELTSSMGGLSRAAALVLSVFMSFSALNIAKDAVMAAARYETLGLSMVQAGRNAGYAEEQMRAFERQLVSGGIAMAEARQTLSRLSAANLDLARSAEMARAAQDLAVVGGINSSEAFERLVQGVVTGNTVSLRTIGLMVDFEGAYARAAAAVNKTAAELTETEKVQARMNAAMESASKYTGIYELSMTTAGKQLGSLTRYLDDLKVLAGQVGLDALAYSVFGLNDGLSGLTARLREMQESGRLEAISKDLGQGLRTLVSLTDDAALAMGVWAVASRLAASEGLKLAVAVGSGNAVMLTSAKAAAGRAAVDHQAAVAAARAAEAEMHRSFAVAAGSATMAEATAAAAALAAAENAVTAANSRTAATANALAAANARATVSARALATASGLATAAGKGLIGIVNALGGPWVVGLTAAATAIYAIATADNAAESAAKAYGSTLSEMEQKYKKLAQGADEAADKTDKLTESHREAIKLQRELQLEAEKTNQAQRLAVLQGMAADSRYMTGLGAEDAAYGFSKYQGVDSSLVNEFREVTQLLQEQKISAGEAATRYDNLRMRAEDAAKGMTGWFNSARGATKNFAGDMLLARNEAVALGESSSFIAKLTSALFGAGSAAKNLLGDLQASSTAFKSYTQGLLSVRMEQDEQTYKNLKSIREQALASGDLSSEQVLAVQKELLTLEEARTQNLKKFSDEQNRAHSKGAAGLERQAGLLERLAARAQELQARVNEDKQSSMLAQWADDLAKFTREAEKLKGASKDQALAYIESIRASVNTLSAREGDKQRAEDMRLMLDFQEQYARVMKNNAAAEILAIQKQTAEWRKMAMQISDVGEREKVLTQIVEMEAQLRTDASRSWLSGAKRAFDDYAAAALDAGKNVEQGISRVFSSLEDAIVGFVTTGKLEISNLANSILADFARIATRQWITGPIASGLGSLFNSFLASAKGNVFDDAPGLSRYSSTVVDRPVFFPFARGIGLMGEAGPEAIMPLGRDAQGRLGVRAAGAESGGAYSPTFHLEPHVHLTASGGSPDQNQDMVDQTMAAMVRVMRGLIRDEIIQQRRSGGALSYSAGW